MAGPRSPRKVAFMLSIRCHARDDLVAFGNLIVEVMISGSRLLLANWLITVTLIEIWNQ